MTIKRKYNKEFIIDFRNQLKIRNNFPIPHTLYFPPTSTHKKCSINIAEETFKNKFFQETVVTTFVFKQSSSYITQNMIEKFYGRTKNYNNSYFCKLINLFNCHLYLFIRNDLWKNNLLDSQELEIEIKVSQNWTWFLVEKREDYQCCRSLKLHRVN